MKDTMITPDNLSGFLALTNTDLTSLMAEELDGLDLTFDKIKIPAGGDVNFELPDTGGESDAVKSFTAVILYHHTMQAYYKSKYVGGNNPPDCGSFDGAIGIGSPGGNCKQCSKNQFGTGENGAKACKIRRRLYILREGELFPLLLSLPTGSIREFTRYMKTLLLKSRKSNSVITRFSLKKVVSNSGVDYSQVQFALDRVLTPAEYAIIIPMSEQVKVYSRRVSIDEDILDMDITYDVDPETGEVVRPLGLQDV